MKQLAKLQSGPGRFGHDLVTIEHTMADSGLFTDEALADLIDRYPRDYFLFDAMTVNGSRQIWRHGDPAGLSGAEILGAIKTGQYWMNLRRFDLIAPEYERLVTRAFGELEAGSPGLKTSRRSSSLLISSPGARVVYHADIPMICLWHLRGKKRVWLYDADNENHLPDLAREAVILRETEEAIPYDPAWDAEASTHDLAPGMAVSWPLNAPHRVDNLEGLNVSITTEYFTPQALRSYGVHFANGWLRRRFGIEPASRELHGAGAVAKIGLAMAVKKLGLQKAGERTVMCDFTLDRKRPGKMIELPRNRRWPIPQQ
jgi:hypothetical protein